MTKEEYVQAIVGRPACSAWEADPEAKLRAIRLALDMTIRRVVLRYDFPFMFGYGTKDTAAGVGVYSLPGAQSNDCRDVIAITLGDSLVNLTHRSIAWYMDARDSAGDEGEPSPLYWIQVGETAGVPAVRIYGTPTEVETMHYTYRKKPIAVEHFPDSWAHVLVVGAEADLFGAAGVASKVGYVRSADPALFLQRFENELSDMIDAYNAGDGQESENIFSKSWRDANRSRNALRGY